MKKITLIEIQKLTNSQDSKYKYNAKFSVNDKIINTKFGAKGYSDYTIHNDTDRRNNYIARHAKDLRTNDPTRAGYLSMYILWNKKSFDASVSDFKKRLKEYNKTGKFPKDIKDYTKKI